MSRPAKPPIEHLIGSLSRDQLVEVLLATLGRHEDVESAVRLAAARSTHDLGALRTEVDRRLRTRRFLGYWEAMEWARAARPVVAELERAVRETSSADLVELLQRAIGHVVKVIQNADDSSGLPGDLARELLELHALACDADVADPLELAQWMIRFRFADQDFFEVDPVRYANALREEGLAAYREAIDAIDDAGSFAVRYARERLAVLNRDIETIIELAGGDLHVPYQFFRVAEAMAELGRDDLALEWAARGIQESDGWQVGVLYDFACETHARLGEPLEVLRLRRAHHERMPSSSTYSALRKAAEEVDAWEVEREAARAALKRRDARGFVDALLGDGDSNLAWEVAVAARDEIDADQWLRIAESREANHPADALVVYQRVVDEVLQEPDRRAYAKAVRLLKHARSAAEKAGKREAFTDHLSRVREEYRRRPTLMAMLEKASF